MTEKVLYLALPLLLICALVGVIILAVRQGRPIRVSLRGLGISFELTTDREAAALLPASSIDKE